MASSDARMREIGGKTSRLVFTSPSSVFLRVFFLSMSETLSCSWLGRGVVRGSAFGGSGRDLAGATAWACSGATSLFSSFLGSFVFGAATGLRAVVLRAATSAAGLRVAVLLLVFVAIVDPSKFRSWLEPLKQSHVIVRVPADALPRKSLAPLFHRQREYPPNPGRLHHAILLNW